ncbi:MAG: toll/interleukin-1 receptor domain-containing protein [Coriobacteriia bacterium]|nr:toll/interleukin-1 receptor domain-containing protein [Coriobacteriia bacterium]
MRVFLSWSGSRSRFLADALRTWLPRVMQSLRPWMSDEDIASGARWLPEVSSELGQAKVGILLVTPENQSNPWLVFEAGALSKTIEQTFVCPLLFDMTPVQLGGPLAQFQAVTLDRAGVLKVLQNLNRALDADRISEVDLGEIFDVWWPHLEAQLLKIPSLDEPVAAPRTTEELLEEILALNREQLRRENVRLEHSQIRDEYIDQFIPVMEQMAGTVRVMQERGEMMARDLPSALHPYINSDVPVASMDQMTKLVRDSSKMNRQALQQLLSMPSESEDALQPETDA